MRHLLFVTPALLVGPATPLIAQEVQVPLDTAGRISVVPAELARRLGLFENVAGLEGVRLFRLPDGNFVLEITSETTAGLQRERRPLTGDEVAALRHDISSRITARAPGASLDQGGRTKLLVGSTILGLGYYGWATAAALDPDDDRTAVAAYMLTAAGSFFVPFLATRNRAVPDAVATMALYGATRGAVHGYAVSQLGNARKDKTKFAWTLAFGGAEAIAGGVVAQSLRMTPGRAELTGVGGDIGLGAGWGIADLLKLDERYRTVSVDQPVGPPFTFQDNDRTLQAAVTLAGAGLGLAGGYAMGSSGDWTRGDAYVFRNVAGIGGLAGITLADLLRRPELITETFPDGPTYSYYEDGYSRLHSALGIAGTAGGVLLGRALVRGRNFTGTQGTLLTLAPVAGGLLGLGVAYLATAEDSEIYDPSVPYRDPDDHSELYLGMGTLGAAAGFAVLYPALSRQAREVAAGSNVQFTVNPLAAAQILAGGRGSVMLGSARIRF